MKFSAALSPAYNGIGPAYMCALCIFVSSCAVVHVRHSTCGEVSVQLWAVSFPFFSEFRGLDSGCQSWSSRSEPSHRPFQCSLNPLSLALKLRKTSDRFMIHCETESRCVSEQVSGTEAYATTLCGFLSNLGNLAVVFNIKQEVQKGINYFQSTTQMLG